jgi:tetratricopeptide (TPR) repeat protein
MKRLSVGRFTLAMLLLPPACSHLRGRASDAPPVAPKADVAALVAAADSLAAGRRFQEAAAEYSAALALSPESLDVAKRALGTFWRSARYDDAYLWGRRVLAREPDSLDALFDVGVTCGFLLELSCVDSLFRRTVQLDPGFVDGHGELGFLSQARGQLPEAIRHMEDAFAAAPANDFAVSGLAQMLIPAGQAARARALMKPRLAANRQARAYGGRSMLTLYGWALLQLGDTAGSDAGFEEVLTRLEARERSGQTTYQLYRERAAIHALRGEPEAAIAAMQTAFDRGWRLYGSWSLTDPMFASVVGDPAVTALVERMRAEVRATRQRLGLENAAR